MKALNSLVRLYKWRVDEKRRRLADIYATRDEYENKLKAIAAAVVREQDIVNTASGSPADVGFSYGAFAQAAIQQRENIQQSIASLDVQISEALEEVAESFKALKRQEIAAANQEMRKTKIRERREQNQTDDQAIESHQRKIAIS